MEEEMEAVLEVCVDGEDWLGVVGVSWVSLSESSSSSPMAKAPFSGTAFRVGERALCGLRRLSTEVLRELAVGLDGSDEVVPSFFRLFIRSISSCPLSRVKDLKASNRFRYLKIAWIKIRLSA